MQRWQEIYAGKRVLVTGHTGFKGAWACLWLRALGARVAGFSWPPEEESLFSLLQLQPRMDSYFGDIRHLPELAACFEQFKPEIVLHMAAQALVLPSYEAPLETFSTNIMGTLHVLECARTCKTVRAVVNVTTDKCYENHNENRAFHEGDRLGGADPYSASKAAVEMVSGAYRASFLQSANIHMATARAGNVIGGGDFSAHRLVPDLFRAAREKRAVQLRHPQATRPWQYMLDALHGYLLLGAHLWVQGESAAQAWNFAPQEEGATVHQLATQIAKQLAAPIPQILVHSATPHEASFLRLDASKARTQLGWKAHMSMQETIAATAAWYRTYLTRPKEISEFTEQQLSEYTHLLSSGA